MSKDTKNAETSDDSIHNIHSQNKFSSGLTSFNQKRQNQNPKRIISHQYDWDMEDDNNVGSLGTGDITRQINFKVISQNISKNRDFSKKRQNSGQNLVQNLVQNSSQSSNQSSNQNSSQTQTLDQDEEKTLPKSPEHTETSKEIKEITTESKNPPINNSDKEIEKNLKNLDISEDTKKSSVFQKVDTIIRSTKIVKPVSYIKNEKKSEKIEKNEKNEKSDKITEEIEEQNEKSDKTLKNLTETEKKHANDVSSAHEKDQKKKKKKKIHQT